MKIFKLLFIILSFFLSDLLFAQAPAIQWQKCLGGSFDEYSHALQSTPDGGYIIAGDNSYNNGDITVNYGDVDAWIVKLDNKGIIQWQKSLGGSKIDAAYDIKNTSDGGYIMAGSTYSNDGTITGNHGNSDSWVVKLNSSGDVQWQKLLGGSASDYAEQIQQTSDGGYIIMGESFSNDGDVSGHHYASNINNPDYWIVKLSSTGIIQWQKSLGGVGYDSPGSIKQTSDNGYIITGYSTSNDGDASGNHGAGDAWIVKLSGAGNIQWQKMYGGTGDDGATSILQTSDGGYFFVGSSNSNNGDLAGGNLGSSDVWLAKLSNTGTIILSGSAGGTGYDAGVDIKPTSDGGYIISAFTESNDGDVSGNHGGRDIWLIKLSNSLTLDWQKILGGSKYDSVINTFQTTDGGYILTASTQSNDGDVSGNHGLTDFWVTKLGPNNLNINEISANNFLSIENPIKENLNIQTKEKIISLQLYNTEGKLIKTSNSKNMQVAELPKGVYILKIKLEDGKILTKKIIKN